MSRIFDSDGHICEPPIVWTEYTERAYRDQVLQVRDHALFLECRNWGLNPAFACIPGQFSNRAATWDDILPGSWDPTARLQVLDEEGIDAASFFPSIYLLIGDIQDAEVAAAMCRAYNRWLSDFCSRDPQRLFGVGLVPMQSVEHAVDETKRLRDLGLRGLITRPERYRSRPLYDPAYDALWDVAQGEGLPVCVHGSFGTRMDNFSTGRYGENLFYRHMLDHTFGQMAAVMDIIAGGVLDRFPRLRVGFFESGLGWLPYWLNRLDEHHEIMGKQTPWLLRRPSDIFRAQCFVSMEGDERSGLEQCVELGIAGCVLWGSDYPHFDAKYPGAYAEAAETFEAVGGGVSERILEENPRRFYGLA